MKPFLIVLSVIGSPPDAEPDYVVVKDAQIKLIKQARVPAREAGVLMDFRASEGDVVRAGQLLGSIDDRLAVVDNELARLEHKIAIVQSENDVDKRFAQKSLDVARSEFKRSSEANRKFANSVSRTELERLQLVTDRSQLAIEKARRDMTVAGLTAQLRLQSARAAELRLQQRRITAPIDGVVVEVFKHEGEWVQPGDTVLRIIKLDRLRVEAHIDGRHHGRELHGLPVDLQVTLPPENRTVSFHGRIGFVSPELQPVTGQIRVWTDIENPELRLRPGDHGQLIIRKRTAQAD